MAHRSVEKDGGSVALHQIGYGTHIFDPDFWDGVPILLEVNYRANRTIFHSKR